MPRKARGRIRLGTKRVGLQKRSRWKKLAIAPFAWAATGWLLTAIDVPYSDVVTAGTMIGSVGLMALLLDQVTRGVLAVRPGSFTVENDAMEFTTDKGTTRIALDDVRGADVERTTDGFDVAFRLRGGDRVTVLVSDEATAVQLLEIAGVGGDRKLLDVRLASRVEQTTGVWAARQGLAMGVMLLGVMAALAPAFGLTALALMVLFGMYPILKASVPPRAIVGSDGLAIKGIGIDEFISFADIDSVREELPGIVVKLKTGEEVLLPMHGAQSAFPEPATRRAVQERAALIERLSREVSRSQSAALSAERHAALDRGGRSIEEWRADVGRLMAPSNGYRAVSLTREDALRILADGGATPERRIAAALALAHVPDAETHDQIRIVVESCASDAVRVALDKAASGELDDDDFDRAVSTYHREHVARVSNNESGDALERDAPLDAAGTPGTEVAPDGQPPSPDPEPRRSPDVL